MRGSIKLSLTGILVAGALAFSTAGAYAMGGGNANGPDAFIGIVGGSPQAYGYSAGGDYPTGYQANTGHVFRNGHNGTGGYGRYDGGYNHGY